MSYISRTACLQFSLFVVSLLLCRSLMAQTDFSAVDQLFKQNQKTLGNDYAALVSKDGKVLYQKQGSADFTAKNAAPIASAGNWLAAAVVMAMVDEGKLSLDDKVTQYIPLFAKYSKGYITIRNCLTHTTGIRGDAEGVMKILQKSKFGSLEEEVNSYATKRDIVTNPGTEFVYSSVGPNIAARVLEVITKKSFDRLANEKILRPCKMRASSFTNDDGGAINPAGGARAAANDYINFMTMLLDKGMFEGKRVLSEKAVAEMETAQFPSIPIRYVPRPTQGLQFGLGCFIQNNEGASGQVLSCPNFLGATPFIDKCRGYVAILIPARPEEEKKPLFTSFKNLVDESAGACK